MVESSVGDSVTQTLEAVYENGVFRPLSAPEGVAEHSRVTISVRTGPNTGSPWDLAGSISREDGEEMQQIVRREFGRVDPDDWK